MRRGKAVSKKKQKKTKKHSGQNERVFASVCMCDHLLRKECSDACEKSLISPKQSSAAQMIAIYFSFPLAKQKWAP